MLHGRLSGLCSQCTNQPTSQPAIQLTNSPRFHGVIAPNTASFQGTLRSGSGSVPGMKYSV